MERQSRVAAWKFETHGDLVRAGGQEKQSHRARGMILLMDREERKPTASESDLRRPRSLRRKEVRTLEEGWGRIQRVALESPQMYWDLDYWYKGSVLRKL